MESPQFLITDYIKKNFSLETDIEKFRNTLYKNGIMTKDYSDEKLLLVYTKFEDSQTIGIDDETKLKNECRSLIIDTEHKNIVSYTCNTPICNLEAMNYLCILPSYQIRSLLHIHQI